MKCSPCYLKYVRSFAFAFQETQWDIRFPRNGKVLMLFNYVYNYKLIKTIDRYKLVLRSAPIFYDKT